MELQSVVRGILEVFDRNGLYSDNGMVAVSGGPPHGLTLDDDKFAALQSGEIPAEEALRSGLAEFYLDVQFDLGELVWQDQFLRPEKAEMDRVFAEMTPDEMDQDHIIATINSILED